jgi:hypothetical protein
MRVLRRFYLQGFANVSCKIDTSKVIVTSYLFPSGKFLLERLQQLSQLVGKDQLVIDVRFLAPLFPIAGPLTL